MKLSLLPVVIVTACSLLAGCSAEPTPGASEGAVVAGTETLDDAALVRELEATLAGTNFVSEGESPWNVVEGDGKDLARIDAKAIDARLGGVIEALEETEGRELTRLRTEETPVEKLFERLLRSPGEEAVYGRMRELVTQNLTDLHVFKFDIKPGGDQDSGPIIIVLVGRSAAGKLIALVTYDVAT